MGFGFNLFGLPLLLLATVVLTLYAIIRRSWRPLGIVTGLWSLTFLMFIAATILDHYRTPISLTKQDIIGEYRIDTTFYPGVNAKWQYDHYRFFITNSDSIEFIIYKDKEIPFKFFKHKITYSVGRRCLWKISADTTYHVIRGQPTLYRGYNKFYYVFRSHIYGNMFFRKQQQKE